MGLISWRTNFVKGLNYFGSVQYFNFKGPNYLSLMRFHYAYMLYYAHYAYTVSLNFRKLWKEKLTSWGKAILQSDWIIWFPLLYFNFKNFIYLNSSLFIRNPCILHESGVLFSVFKNLLKLKRGNLISWGEPILQND